MVPILMSACYHTEWTPYMLYIMCIQTVVSCLAILCYRVDGELNVVVSDFGLSRDVFYSDYYRLTHKALLPIKWMAPESLRDQIFNEKTDVVSYE